MSYEDCYIYLDLTKDIIKKKDLLKSIKYYIEEKNKINIKGHYGVLLFQEEGNPIFITDKKDSEIITTAIEENWSSRSRKESYFENGLFYLFGYIAETTRKKSKLNRVIVITDTPSDLNDEYQEALFNIVSKIKHFPTFIDIVRLIEEETRFQKDDVKLNVLASDTKGGIFYVKDKKEFSSTLKKLVKTKQTASIFADRPDEMKISSEDYAFYNNLAKNLEKGTTGENVECDICHDETCPVCTDVSDIPMTCVDCKISYHLCCITNYTINHNIGIPHIFRCPNCDVLLKIDQNLIVSTEGPEIISVDDYIEQVDYNHEPDNIVESEYTDHSDDDPKIVEFEETRALKLEDSEITQTFQASLDSEKAATIEDESTSGEQKTIRVGGFFGKVYTVKKVGGKLIYSRSSQTAGKKEKEDSNELQEPKELIKQKITICPICGNTVSSTHTICKSCGSEIK
jgi:rubrerythrin